jgi:ribosomal protein S18 acetylase RimI-like enzyme
MTDEKPVERSADISANSALRCQIDVLRQDQEWAMAHFTFMADVTTLADDCDIVCSPTMSVASYHGLPFPALAFLGDSPELLANYTTFLVKPGVEVTFLVNEEQRPIVEEAFVVSEIIPEWQMIYRGTGDALDVGEATALQPRHLPAAQRLANAAGLHALPDDPLAQGPAFGIWEGRSLMALATTRLTLPGAVEIGAIATHPNARRKGYATNVLSALIKAHDDGETSIFLMAYQSNLAALRLYKKLGFQKERPMYLIHCLVGEEDLEPSESGLDIQP